VDPRREGLRLARLYLVCDEQSDEFLEACLRGGVDLIQLRIKQGADQAILAAAERFKRVCHAHGAMLIINDRPDLAAAVDADGVHLGQDDVPVATARQIVGGARLIGLSTHTPAQIDASACSGADYIGVGPVNETPTKPGRPAVGHALVDYAARRAALPFFAIGGISVANVEEVCAAGARRVAVVRALTDAADAEAAARALRDAVTHKYEAQLGRA
jgi:thiamine-phosphate pyrophosphorylase